MRFIEVFIGNWVLLNIVGFGIIYLLAIIITFAGFCFKIEESCFLELRAFPGCFIGFKVVLTIKSLFVLFSAVRKESLFCFKPT